MLVLTETIKGNNSYKLMVHVKFYCSGAFYLTAYKTVFSLAKICDNTTKVYFISTDNVFHPSWSFRN